MKTIKIEPKVMEEEAEMGFPVLSLKKILVLKRCSKMRLNQSQLNI